MKEPIYIEAKSCISSIGNEKGIDLHNNPTSYSLSLTDQNKLNNFLSEHPKYKKFDRSAQMAIYVAHQAFLDSSITNDDIGVNFGSSRGATELWENNYDYFLKNNKTRLLASPLTTLGNISSNVAQHLESSGPLISHSITCSTSLQAISNAIAWINSGMCEQFIVGGSEAPLTAFTENQLKALKIYSTEKKFPFSQPFNSAEKNTLKLGEGAAAFILSKNKSKAIAKITGIGYAIDNTSSLTGIPEDGENVYQSMKMALKGKTPDLIIAHAPGTKLGDKAEFNAIERLFNKQIDIWSSKSFTGHTLGASGAISVAIGTELLNNKITLPKSPYSTYVDIDSSKTYNSILINAIGFGGNAASILIEKI